MPITTFNGKYPDGRRLRGRPGTIVGKTPAVLQGHSVSRWVWAAESHTGELSPGVSSIEAFSGTQIRVHFISAAVNNVALNNAANYTIAPLLIVHSVTPEGVTNPTYVDLVIDEQSDGEVYTLTMQRIIKA